MWGSPPGDGPPKLQTLPSGQRGLIVDARIPFISLIPVAENVTLGLGHNWVRSEHLVLAIMQLVDPRLREVLERHRVFYNEVRRVVLELLQH